MSRKNVRLKAAVMSIVIAIVFSFRPYGPKAIHRLAHFEPRDIQIRDAEASLGRFAAGLHFRTVSNSNLSKHITDQSAFKGLHNHLRKSFPKVHRELQLKKVNEWSLLYKWPGRNSTSKPVLCISHQDVVPATSEASWIEPPFSGSRKDGYIWGRGAQDVKITVFALLEAVTNLLDQGWASGFYASSYDTAAAQCFPAEDLLYPSDFQPERTLYLAFGHDEEVGGGLGAKAMAEYLEAQGVQLEFVLDEGGPLLVDGLQPFIKDKAVALVGTAEKGYVSMDVHFKGKGGHSALPPADGSQAVTQLARVLTDMYARLPPAQLVSPTLEFLQGMGLASSNPLIRFVLARNLSWPLKQLLAQFLARQPGEVAAAVRTTVAVTGVTTHPAAGNVLPSLASVQLNFRYLPGEREDFAERYLEKLLPRHADVNMHKHARHEMASAVTRVNGSAFAIVHQAIQETLAHGRVVATLPFLLTGGTDSKHYQGLCGGQTLRFMPVAMNRSAGDLKRVHGMDERIAEGAFLDAIRFYIRFIQLAVGSSA